MKRIVYKTGILTGLCLIVLAGILLLFWSIRGESWLKKKIVSEIQTHGITCTIENLDITRRTTLRFINIHFSTENDRNVCITGSISEVSIRIKPKLFHSLTTWIDNILILEPEITISQKSTEKKTLSNVDNNQNIPQNLLSIYLPSIEIQGGIFYYKEQSYPLEGTFKNLGLNLFQTTELQSHLNLYANLESGFCKDLTIPPVKIDGHAIFGSNGIHLNSFNLSGAGLKVCAEGNLFADTLHPQMSGRIHFQGELDSLYLLNPALSNISSDFLSVECNITGEPSFPNFRLAGTIPDLKITDFTIDRIHFHGFGNPDSVTLDSFSCALLGGSLHGKGEYCITSQTYKTSAALQNLSLSKLQTSLGLTATDYHGIAEGTLSGIGSLDRMDLAEIHGHIRIFDQHYQNTPLPDASFSLLQERQILRFRSTMRKTQIYGDFQVRQDSVSGQWHVNLPDIQPAAEWFGIDSLSGALNFSGKILGNYRTPRLHAALKGQQLTWKRWQCDFLNFSAGMDNDAIQIYNANAEMASTMFHWNGNYERLRQAGSFQITWHSHDRQKESQNRLEINFQNKEDGWQLDAQSNDIELETLDILIDQKQNISGKIQLHASLSGLPYAPQGKVKITGREPSYQKILMDSIKTIISIYQDTLRLDTLQIHLNQGYFSLSGKTNWRPLLDKQLQINGHCSCDTFPLDLIQTQFMEDGIVQGVLSGDLDFQYSDNLLLFGKLSFENGQYQQSEESTIVSNLQGNFIFDGSDFFIKNLTGQTGHQTLTSQLEISRKKPGYFLGNGNLIINNEEVLFFNANISPDSVFCDARLNRITLSSFHTLFPDLNWLYASVSGQTSIEGSLKHPDLKGELNVDNISIYMPLLKNQWTDGKAKIHLHNHTILLDTLYISNSKKGNLQAKGELNLKDNQWKYDLDAIAANIILEKEKSFLFHLKNAVFNAHGNIKSGNITGQISMDESKWMEDLDTKKFIPFFQQVEVPGQSPPDWMNAVALNIRCADCNNLWVDNNIAKIHINTNMELGGTLARPVILGNLRVEEGYAFYLDRKFSIETGILNFGNPYQIQPDMDVIAKARLDAWETLSQKSYDITLAMNGSLDKPQMTLSSVPLLASPDIVSLLTLGATRDELSMSGNSGLGLSFTDVLQDRAVMYSGQRLTRMASSKLTMWSGLDQITVNGNLLAIGKTWSPRVLASKKINDRLQIIYSTEIGHANEQSIRLDYKLNKKWSIEGQANQKNQAGLDIKYKIIQ